MMTFIIALTVVAVLAADDSSSVEDCLDSNNVADFPATAKLVQCSKQGSASVITKCVIQLLDSIPADQYDRESNESNVVEAALCISKL
ncbi:hypothetical protein RB195_015964 [Necator americanus]|uniref:Uncharacterized protein n=1 Tax=Necator americanus TaxID=51031 RepID=A0ABR1E705_NECAM